MLRQDGGAVLRGRGRIGADQHHLELGTAAVRVVGGPVESGVALGAAVHQDDRVRHDVPPRGKRCRRTGGHSGMTVRATPVASIARDTTTSRQMVLRWWSPISTRDRAM